MVSYAIIYEILSYSNIKKEEDENLFKKLDDQMANAGRQEITTHSLIVIKRGNFFLTHTLRGRKIFLIFC